MQERAAPEGSSRKEGPLGRGGVRSEDLQQRRSRGIRLGVLLVRARRQRWGEAQRGDMAVRSFSLFGAFLCFMREWERQEGMGERGEDMQQAKVHRQESNPGHRNQD